MGKSMAFWLGVAAGVAAGATVGYIMTSERTRGFREGLQRRAEELGDRVRGCVEGTVDELPQSTVDALEAVSRGVSRIERSVQSAIQGLQERIVPTGPAAEASGHEA